MHRGIFLFLAIFAEVLGASLARAAAPPMTFIFTPARPPLEHFVMMPLKPITDWTSFRLGLRTLKHFGVRGVTTDICWGLVRENWDYYRKLGTVLREEGIAWANILSTHAIGGNVGDDVDIPIPEEVWSTVPGAEYVSRSGFRNREVISVFSNDKATKGAIAPFYQAWRAQIYDEFRDILARVYVGSGPASEVRYPSYVFADGFEYPAEGSLPIYSAAAIGSWQAFLKIRYEQDIQQLNAAWNVYLPSFDGPTGPQPPSESAGEFLRNARGTAYYRDLMDWYRKSLSHGLSRQLRWLAEAVHGDANKPLGKPFALKVAGVHWQRKNPLMPHAAEILAGYETYDDIFAIAAAQGLGITFTCLEMRTHADGFPEYSDPEGLAADFFAAASRHRVRLSGENALALGSADPLGVVRWLADGRNAESALHTFTFLRWQHLVDEAGQATALGEHYREILVRPHVWQVRYQAPQTMRAIEAAQLQFRLVPISPVSMRWQWEESVPLSTPDPDSNVLEGEWTTVDSEAAWMAIGAVDVNSGARVQMTHPQPKKVFRHHEGQLLMSWRVVPVPKVPELDGNTQSDTLARCAALLAAPLQGPDKDMNQFVEWIKD